MIHRNVPNNNASRNMPANVPYYDWNRNWQIIPNRIIVIIIIIYGHNNHHVPNHQAGIPLELEMNRINR